MMQQGDYVLGVDGGGTKTHCALYDRTGNLKDFMEWGATNHEVLIGGFEALKRELKEMLDALLSRNHIGRVDLASCVLGMAGVDTAYQHDIISQMIRDCGIEDFQLCNDSYLGIKAGSQHGLGICAINGTGFSVTGIDKNGAMQQIGGFGHLSADKGGGGYLFEQAVAAVYASLYKGERETVMKQWIFDLLEIDHKSVFLEKTAQRLQMNDRDFMRRVNMMIYEAADARDAAALRILEEVGEAYAKSVGGMLQELDFSGTDKIELILAGSNFTKCTNTTSIDRLKASLCPTGGSYEFDVKILGEPCVLGAVLWALERAGVQPDRDKVLRAYQRFAGF